MEELRASGFISSRLGIRTKALKLLKEPKYNIPGVFKASDGWCTRFFARSGLTLRQRTHIAQKLPKDVDFKVEEFHKFVIDERKKFEFCLSQIGNMDETPMYFDMPGNKTVDFKGSKSVSIKTTGHEKQHFTVVL